MDAGTWHREGAISYANRKRKARRGGRTHDLEMTAYE